MKEKDNDRIQAISAKKYTDGAKTMVYINVNSGILIVINLLIQLSARQGVQAFSESAAYGTWFNSPIE